jgi:hypothetical protein
MKPVTNDFVYAVHEHQRAYAPVVYFDFASNRWNKVTSNKLSSATYNASLNYEVGPHMVLRAVAQEGRGM